ncbi:LCP family protein [Rudaeicoccus suwonensis]|uniref:LytR family transcriptional attenuator n=1 Tax=Rudaeicoccus suwonensis TaxID=657409 RepID=A0A561E8R2_9MICO|nr:LCP family protein [Rudaeicoccus suwonensis]TWE11999.1 LytR family transcriptional attenuator [Rudaeicoccus suwonensis]
MGPLGNRKLRRRVFAGIAGVLSLALVAVAVYAGYLYNDLSGIRRSAALQGLPVTKVAGTTTVHGVGTNLLVMGLDSRLDENGNPLPEAIYSALHSGDQDDGGLNSNVLMLIHIPASGSPVTAVSIPRDDYVAFPGCPDGECAGKIKEAYGLATAQAQQQLSAKGITGEAAYQKARDAGRRAEIQTVDQFLGVQINSFIEVTMVAFYQFAQVIQPITVCLKENTVDTFSGANFHAGVQEINAKQAMAFVRQRRDTSNPALNFTDLDRERRQQAFVISVLTQLKSAGTLLNPAKVIDLINVAKKNVVLSDGLDPLTLASLGEKLADAGGLHFYTLPVQSFGVINGQDVNIVNQPQIEAIVAHLLDSTASATAAAPAVGGYTVSVVNSSGVTGAAHARLAKLVAKGYRQGTATTGAQLQTATQIEYNPLDEPAAAALAASVPGSTLVPDSAVGAGQLTLVLGTAQGSASTQPLPQAVAGTGGGVSGPPVTALTVISSGSIPCVK